MPPTIAVPSSFVKTGENPQNLLLDAQSSSNSDGRSLMSGLRKSWHQNEEILLVAKYYSLSNKQLLFLKDWED